MLMWAYALAWFVFNDVMKMLTYQWLRSRRGQAYLASKTTRGAFRQLV